MYGLPVTLGTFADMGWTVKISAESSLAVQRVVNRETVGAGEAVAYGIAVTNTSQPALNVVITDVVPVHTVLQPGSLSPSATFSGIEAGSVIPWESSVSPGLALERSFAVIVDSETEDGFTIECNSSLDLSSHI